jgi:hypothetical protein
MMKKRATMKIEPKEKKKICSKKDLRAMRERQG